MQGPISLLRVLESISHVEASAARIEVVEVVILTVDIDAAGVGRLFRPYVDRGESQI